MAKKNTPAPKVAEPVEEVFMDDPNMVTPEEAQAAEVPAEPVAKAKAQAPKSSAKFSDHLKGTLAKHPHINNVWVNEKGEWFYSKKAGFTSYSREEILNG